MQIKKRPLKLEKTTVKLGWFYLCKLIFAIKLYYVKVNNLGYVIADDEIEEVSE
jgi:hypothetical protein